MNNTKIQFFGESKLKDQPKKKLRLKIADKAIKIDHLSDEVIELLSGADVGSLLLCQDFGDSPVRGISQKKLTEAYNEIKARLEALENGQGISPYNLELDRDSMILYLYTNREVDVPIPLFKIGLGKEDRDYGFLEFMSLYLLDETLKDYVEFRDGMLSINDDIFRIKNNE